MAPEDHVGPETLFDRQYLADPFIDATVPRIEEKAGEHFASQHGRPRGDQARIGDENAWRQFLWALEEEPRVVALPLSELFETGVASFPIPEKWMAALRMPRKGDAPGPVIQSLLAHDPESLEDLRSKNGVLG